MSSFSGHIEKKYHECSKMSSFSDDIDKKYHEHSKTSSFNGHIDKKYNLSIFYRHRSASRVMKMERYGSVTGALRPELSMMFLKKSLQKS